MTKKKKDYTRAILERIVGTKSKTYLADEFKNAFAEKLGIKKEELKNTPKKAKGQATASPLSTLDEPPKRSLNNKEREVLKTLPSKIENLEIDLEKLSSLMASADYYQDPQSDLTGDAKKVEALEVEILRSYEQLEGLETN